MKKLVQSLYLIILIAFVACGGNTGNGTQSGESLAQESDSVDIYLDSLTISKLKKVYSLNLELFQSDNFMKGYSKPEEEAKVIAAFQFGDTIPVIENLENGWLAVYVNLKQRKGDSSKNKAFIKESDLGDIKDLTLEEEEFKQVISESGELYTIGNDTIKIELITEKEFNKKKGTRPSSLENIKHGVKQEDGTLSLVSGRNIINLKDKNPILDSTLHDDQVLIYSYKGFNKELNAYMVKQEEWESNIYTLYSQATGEVLASTNAYPIFSPDNNYLADFTSLQGEGVTQFNLQKRDEKGKYNSVCLLNFKKWTILHADNDSTINYFFDNDGAIYLKTIVMQGAGTDLEKVKGLIQFVKISITLMP